MFAAATERRNPWPAIVGYYLAGVLAAAQLGKMSALASLIAADLQLSLTTVAVAVSLIEIGGAMLGVVAGMLASRMGLERVLLGALACLALSAAGSTLAHGGATLLGWRILEALGYLGVVVTAPVLIARAATPAHVGVAMALWSTFVPVGIAVGAWAWAAVASSGGWRMAMGLGAGLAAVATVSASWLLLRLPASGAAPPVPGDHDKAASHVDPTVWLLSASFGCYALFEVGSLALLPTYLNARAGASVAEAGRWAAFAALATIGGSTVAAWWLRTRRDPRVPVLLALLLPALLGFGVFVEMPALTLAASLGLLLNAISGAYPSFAFAWLPAAAGDASRLVRANGVFTQFGASGSLLGPPLTAWFVDRFGWPAAAWCSLGVTLTSIVFALLTMQRLTARRHAAVEH